MFFHYRYHARFNTKLAGKDAQKYVYYELCLGKPEEGCEIMSHGGVTIALIPIPIKDHPIPETISINRDLFYVGFAKCDDKDSYCKRIGRAIAEGRARKWRFIVPFGKDKKQDMEWLEAIKSMVYANNITHAHGYFEGLERLKV